MMKHKLSIKRTHYIGYALLLLQTFFVFVSFLLLLANRYEDQWKNYLNDQTKYSVYLNRIPNDKKTDVISYLKSEAENQKFLLLKKENINNSFSLGVAGDDADIDSNFIFDGQRVISKKDLNKLIYSNNAKATLGLGQGSINQLVPIYKFPFGKQVVIYKIDQFNELNKTINGKYQLVGLSSKGEYNSIVRNLAKITSLNEEIFEHPASGEAQDDSLLYSFLIIGLLVTDLGLLAFFFISLLSSFRRIGTLILLGWSKKTILFKQYKKFAFFVLLTALIFSISFVLSQGINLFFKSLVISFLMAALVSLLMFTAIFVVASLIVVFSNNVSLIKGKYPTKIVYIFITGLYALISGLLLSTAIYIDGPTKAVAANARQAIQWQKVERMEVLKRIAGGDDGIRSFSDSSSQLYRDVYNFYKNIAGKKGVYLISSFYGSREWLADRDLYKEMPTRPFTTLSVSPNYLKKIGFSVSNSALRKARQGQRIFYVPDTYSPRQRSKLKTFFKDMLTDDISKSDVQTAFTKKQQLSLFTYHPDKNIFLWNSDTNEPTHSKTPFIDIVTPENMTFVDIGNIQVTGLEGNLKFENKAVSKRILTKQRLAKYHLNDNQLEYTTVDNYIDGEQKSLWQTIAMFGAALVLLLIILCLLIVVLAMTYKTSNKRTIAVKKFLGFTFWQIYRLLLLIIGIATAIEVIIILVARSRIGLLLIVFNYLTQMSVFYLYNVRTQFTQIIDSLRGERL